METSLALATDLRVRFITFIEGKILFIHRITKNHPEGYYVLPGGGVDDGETPEIALLREAEEEVNLVITPQRLLFTAIYKGTEATHTQLFYECGVISGELMAGNGIESSPEWQAEFGTHTPVLLDITDISLVTIQPRCAQIYLTKYAENIAASPYITYYDL